jgi:Rhs element Vgr protein
MNENSSCWIRVSSPWAGSNYGGIHIPRIGQEVIVDFLNGDPDYPIITGRVYNAMQMPPWDLPGNKTQSGFLTRSTKGGTPGHGLHNSPGTANAIRFEDKAGSGAAVAACAEGPTHRSGERRREMGGAGPQEDGGPRRVQHHPPGPHRNR